MQTAQIDKITNKVVAIISPPTATSPINGRYHIDVDENVVGEVLNKTYDPMAKTFS